MPPPGAATRSSSRSGADHRRRHAVLRRRRPAPRCCRSGSPPPATRPPRTRTSSTAPATWAACSPCCSTRAHRAVLRPGARPPVSTWRPRAGCGPSATLCCRPDPRLRVHGVLAPPRCSWPGRRWQAPERDAAQPLSRPDDRGRKAPTTSRDDRRPAAADQPGRRRRHCHRPAAGPPPPPKPGRARAIKKGSKQQKASTAPAPGSSASSPPRAAARGYAQPAAAAAQPRTRRHRRSGRNDRRPAAALDRPGRDAVQPDARRHHPHVRPTSRPIPLFWVMPLALYLLSFILVFMRWPVVWIGSRTMRCCCLQPLLWPCWSRAPCTRRRAQSAWWLPSDRDQPARLLRDGPGLSRRAGQGPAEHQAPDRFYLLDVGRRHARRHVQRPACPGGVHRRLGVPHRHHRCLPVAAEDEGRLAGPTAAGRHVRRARTAGASARAPAARAARAGRPCPAGPRPSSWTSPALAVLALTLALAMAAQVDAELPTATPWSLVVLRHSAGHRAASSSAGRFASAWPSARSC